MQIQNKEKKWYVLYTYPRAEKRVGKQLTELGVENFLPLRKELRKWHDRKKWVEIPLISSYIFVKIEEVEKNRVFEVQGILKFVTHIGKAVTVSEQEIERIHQICNYVGEVSIRSEKLGVGDEVEIIGGQLSGIQGELVGFEKNNRIRLSILSLSCYAYIEIEEVSVIKVKKN